jgi:DNA-binding PadR family transcriptional regulator
MSRWLASGLRRDCCIALAGGDAPTGQELKAAVEAHYDERIPPRRFRGALEALAETGHVTERTDGIHDRYELTDAGRDALETHAAWLCGRVGDADGSDSGA